MIRSEHHYVYWETNVSCFSWNASIRLLYYYTHFSRNSYCYSKLKCELEHQILLKTSISLVCPLSYILKFKGSSKDTFIWFLIHDNVFQWTSNCKMQPSDWRQWTWRLDNCNCKSKPSFELPVPQSIGNFGMRVEFPSSFSPINIQANLQFLKRQIDLLQKIQICTCSSNTMRTNQWSLT